MLFFFFLILLWFNHLIITPQHLNTKRLTSVKIYGISLSPIFFGNHPETVNTSFSAVKAGHQDC